MNPIEVQIRCDHCAGEGEIRYKVIPIINERRRWQNDWDIGTITNLNTGQIVAWEDANIHDKELIRAVFAEQPEDEENSGVCERCAGASCEHI